MAAALHARFSISRLLAGTSRSIVPSCSASAGLTYISSIRQVPDQAFLAPSASRAMSAVSGSSTSYGKAAEAEADPASSAMPFESTTISDLLKAKGVGNDGSWLFCTTQDSVFDAVKTMTSHNVGALLVTSADTAGSIAGIITERDYLRKIIVQGRSSKTTKVGDIMTEENKLITVSPDTKLLRAMELMTENRIRHIPVCENKMMKGMVSIGDVVRAVVDEHREEVQRLSDYIKGSY